MTKHWTEVMEIRRVNAVYFDTCNAGPQLAEYQAKAGEQNETVLAIFQRSCVPLSPSQVLAQYPRAPMPPLTSIRRAISTLTKSGELVKTETKRKGVYGRMEHVWTLPDAVRQKLARIVNRC